MRLSEKVKKIEDRLTYNTVDIRSLQDSITILADVLIESGLLIDHKSRIKDSVVVVDGRKYTIKKGKK